MRSIKLSLAGLVALGLMALVGVSSASATTICTELGKTECPPAKRYTGSLTANASQLAIDYGSERVTHCDAHMKFFPEENLGRHFGIAGQVTNMSFENCEGKEKQYCYNVQPGGYSNDPMRIEETEAGNTMTVTKGSGEMSLTLLCQFFHVECHYTTSKSTFTYGGGAPGVVIANKVTFKHPAEETCTDLPSEISISGAFIVEGEQSFSASAGKAVLYQLSGGEHKAKETCSGGSTMNGGLTSQITSLTFSGCSGLCTSMAGVNTPYPTHYTASGNMETSNVHLKFSTCPLGLSCEFTANPVSFKVTGSQLAANDVELTRISGGLCPTILFWEAPTYSVSPGWKTFALSPEP